MGQPQSQPERGRWRKSSYSTFNGSCVEASARWQKSSHCAGGECLEVATAGSVLVRDSKLGDASPVLSFTRAEWAGFTSALKLS